MPDDAARKKLIRSLAQHKGISYTAAMRLLDKHVARPVPVLKPGEAYAMFRRPVGIIARPELVGPVFSGSLGRGEDLRELWLQYGSSKPPQAFVVTNVPLPGERPATGVLVTALLNFLARRTEARYADGRRRMPDAEREAMLLETQRLVEQAPREQAEVWLGGTRVPGVRVRVDGCEALEIPYLDGCIVYCGPREQSAALRLDLDRP
ncbi:MAG TPA: hypothetical protein VHW44_02600 [Pseudonocardiaceae bacterium]|nr:hypothetical protein [Pseudonocardiaceae bacterium]